VRVFDEHRMIVDMHPDVRSDKIILRPGQTTFNRQPVTFVATGCASDLVPMRSSLAEA